MVGRPKEFDEKRALGEAMEVFWAEGYEAASVETLLHAMGINRGSMYDTFGDKHALFLAAIKQYGDTVIRGLEETLSSPGPVLETLRRVLTGMGQAGGDRCRGCLATNTIVETAPHDPEVAKATKCLLRRIETSFQSALDRARRAGEIPRGSDTKALARFLATTAQGLVVMSKGRASRAHVRDTVAVTIAALG